MERSGIGLVEGAVLEALDSLGARPDRGFRRSTRVLAELEDRIGLAPGYGYPVLVDLAQPWTVPVTLVEGQGNFGSRSNDLPSNFRYTEARLSSAGQVVLAAERGDLAPVPVGLINGSTYREGTRPPFRPQAIIDAIRQVIHHPRVTSQDIIDIIGPPDFVTGCTVTGDFAALAAGHPAELRLLARLTISEDCHHVLVENIPPNVSIDDAAISIADRARSRQWERKYPGLRQATGLQLQDMRDETDERHHPYGRILCTPLTGTPPELLRDQLMDIYGVSTTMPVALPRSLPALIRQWVRNYQSEDLLTSLATLEAATRG
jgi:DNA gyrase/topoisomerase IV subunit A